MSKHKPKFITGAYRIRNMVNGMVYVGGAYASFEQRKSNHMKALKANRHGNEWLQRAWNKYGEDSFVFEILERCCPEDTGIVEQKWLDFYRAGLGVESYNSSPFATKPPSALGKKRSVETRKKMSLANMGNCHPGWKHTPEAKIKLSIAAKKRMANPEHLAAVLERLHTPEVFEKISVSMTKRYEDPKHREAIADWTRVSNADPKKKAKIAATVKKQWADPEVRKKKIEGMNRANSDPAVKKRRSESSKARWKDPEKRAVGLAAARTPEKRAKLSAAGKGRIVSLETRAKISNTLKGHPVSEETKAKMRERVVSEEVRAKISVKAKAQWEVPDSLTRKVSSLPNSKRNEHKREVKDVA